MRLFAHLAFIASAWLAGKSKNGRSQRRRQSYGHLAARLVY